MVVTGARVAGCGNAGRPAGGRRSHGGGSLTFEDYATSRMALLLRTARAITQDDALAEDLVQDVLLKVYVQWPRVAQARQPDAYVRRILVNEYLSWKRKWARLIPTDRVDRDEDAPDDAERQDDRDELTSHLRRLPKRQQVVLALRYFGGLTDQEIAETMGCTPGTVRGYAARALSSLRHTMQLDHQSNAERTES
jgi:RNA polymerase sigma-70 factor (sigma-E family)